MTTSPAGSTPAPGSGPDADDAKRAFRIRFDGELVNFDPLPWESDSFLLDRVVVFIRALDKGASISRAHCLSRCAQNKVLFGSGYSATLEDDLKDLMAEDPVVEL